MALGKLARVGRTLAIVERPGDRVRSKPHRFTAYRIDETEPGERFSLDPARAHFVLHETHFASPPDWVLAAIFLPLTLTLALALLRPTKGAIVGVILALDMLKSEPKFE